MLTESFYKKLQNSAVTGMVRLRLLGNEVPELPAGVRQLRIVADKVNLPREDTFYSCSVHKLPPEFRDKHHVVQYEADIQAGNEDVVHHMEVFHCQIFPEANKEFPIWSGR